MAVAGGVLAFASALGPWNAAGVGSTLSGRELASLILSGTAAHWVPPVVGAGLYLIPLCGAISVMAAGIRGRTGRVLMTLAAVVGTVIGTAVSSALRWEPLTRPGWGSFCLALAVTCWAAAAIAWRAPASHRGRPVLAAAVAVLVALGVAPAAPADASPATPAQQSTCESTSKPDGGEIPVAVVLVEEANRGKLDRQLEDYDVLGRYLLPQPTTAWADDGWEQLPMTQPEAELDMLLPDAPLVVVPVGDWSSGKFDDLKRSTGSLVAVTDPVNDPTESALRNRVEQTYAQKADSVTAEIAPLEMVAEQDGRTITLTAQTLPGETARVSATTVTESSGLAVTCPADLDLPATIKLPGTGTRGGNTTISASLSSVVGVTPARSPRAVTTDAASSGSSASTTTSDDAGPSGSDSDETPVGRDGPASTVDEAGSSGLPLGLAAALIAAAGAAGYLIARSRMHRSAPNPPPDLTSTEQARPARSIDAAAHTGAVHQRPHPPAPGWTAAVRAGTDVRLEDVGLARLTPLDTTEGRVWADETGQTIAMACWLEKKPDLGEDAEPTLRLHESGAGLIGVYDGTGGSGAGVARRLRDGTELTGAYVASRLSREVTETWFTEQIDSRSTAVAASGLADQLAPALRDEAASLGAANGMKGSLHRVLPTTLTAIAFDVAPGGAVSADVLWAGDSRAYALTADQGLQVLSVDDTRETDALALIRNDQPMTNLVSADRPFIINQLRYEIGSPSLLVVATDGCFGYVRTPAHFEYLLLRTLLEAPDAAGWGRLLLRSLHAFTADDASLSLVGIGFDSYVSLQRAMAPRCEYLHREHWLPFEHADGLDADQLREASWGAYRDRYHSRVLVPEDVQ